jgi:hypothetical protein
VPAAVPNPAAVPTHRRPGGRIKIFRQFWSS